MTVSQIRLLIGSVVLALSPSLHAATVAVSDVVIEDPATELVSFTAGGTHYTQSDLIQPTLTAYQGLITDDMYSDFSLLTKPRESVPPPGSRSHLLTHDFALDTGIIQFAVGPTSGELTFMPGLVNGPGPDLVAFDGGDPDGLQVKIDDTVIAYHITSYILPISFEIHQRDTGMPMSITELETGSFIPEGRTRRDKVGGIAIDLDDFAVAPFASISHVQFGSIPDSNHLDAMLFMGINSPPVALLGDLNVDGGIDFDDISAFVLGLRDPAEYESTFGIVPSHNGDMNEDGDFDFDDIPGFVQTLRGEAIASDLQSVPEPESLTLGLLAALVLTGYARSGQGLTLL